MFKQKENLGFHAADHLVYQYKGRWPNTNRIKIAGGNPIFSQLLYIIKESQSTVMLRALECLHLRGANNRVVFENSHT
jgi:hypothetical protein